MSNFGLVLSDSFGTIHFLDLERAAISHSFQWPISNSKLTQISLTENGNLIILFNENSIAILPDLDWKNLESQTGQIGNWILLADLEIKIHKMVELKKEFGISSFLLW